MSDAPSALGPPDVPSASAPAENVHERLKRRVRSEYLEMPGLGLTLDQASRLWGLDRDTCSRVLGDLITDGFLVFDGRGLFVRRTTA